MLTARFENCHSSKSELRILNSKIYTFIYVTCVYCTFSSKWFRYIIAKQYCQATIIYYYYYFYFSSIYARFVYWYKLINIELFTIFMLAIFRMYFSKCFAFCSFSLKFSLNMCSIKYKSIYTVCVHFCLYPSTMMFKHNNLLFMNKQFIK